MPAPSLRIVLAEDSALVREGIVELLHKFGHQVVRAVGDADSLITAVRECSPDIVVTDVRMPPGHGDDGLRATMELRKSDPDLPVLVLSQYVANAYAKELFTPGRTPHRQSRAGLGYLLKDRIGELSEFAQAVERVAAGAMVIDPQVVQHILMERDQRHQYRLLSAREQEVLGLMAHGYSNAMVRDALSISDGAVAKHIGNIFAKLGLSPDDGNRRVLAVLAYLRDE
ncbi:DNA-binding response regulator [Streptomyces sp. CB02923]|uniref:response regulator transcription factor n=1 Tax=Streptomyces sp. CB02923 TaxID=1718985 RepID=UPI000939DE89|nr:response regulator transcription factor [Streptomyces sp. CB02923]OKI01181.1 DNA-binding response regulator [Streptomyces sp. CB02923]